MAVKKKRRGGVLDTEINIFFLTCDELVKFYQCKTLKQRKKFAKQLAEHKDKKMNP